MFARYLLIVLGLISLLWIGYVALEIVETKESLSPGAVFGKEDQRLLIINRANEVNLAFLGFTPTQQVTKVISPLLTQLDHQYTLYLSDTRDHFMIEKKHGWSKAELKKLCKSAGWKMTENGIRSFTVNGFKLRYLRDFLYFSRQDYSTSQVEGWSLFDRKSSAALIAFVASGVEMSDIYARDGGVVEFRMKNEG